MKLFHYTCKHGYEGIMATGEVRPNNHPLIGLPIAWFTDIDTPDADAVGLTSYWTRCDRLTHHVEVDGSIPVPWLGSAEQALVSPQHQADLHRYAQPDRWWISRIPIPVLEAA